MPVHQGKMPKIMTLRGEKVNLRPMTLEEVPVFYKWAIQSPFWYGKPYGDPTPTYEEFVKDWGRHYFEGSEPEKGRAFAIIVGNKVIGEINYNEINRKDNSVELDILIYEDVEKGKGYGPDALKTLANYLFSEMKVRLCCIEPVTKNRRAIRAYEKAGFKIAKTFVKDGIEVALFELRAK
jgi:RimJ/RimL family protein N-acetyltransferase